MNMTTEQLDVEVQKLERRVVLTAPEHYEGAFELIFRRTGEFPLILRDEYYMGISMTMQKTANARQSGESLIASVQSRVIRILRGTTKSFGRRRSSVMADYMEEL